MSDLIAFLSARLDEDEAIVETIRSGGFPAPAWTTEPARGGKWEILRDADDPTPLGYVTRGRRQHDHIARHDPARVLREVEADRRLLDACQGWQQAQPSSEWESDYTQALEWTVRVRATVYSDHPDYRQEWKP